MPKTAVFGGTFNPFHIGHYEMLKALQNDGNIEKILLLPDKIPPHKTKDFSVNDTDRINMCKAVADEFSKAELCLIEFLRDGKSYTYDTVKELKKAYGENLVFVCGADMLVTFEQWYKYEQLMKEIPFIVFKRSDIEDSYLYDMVEKFEKMGMDVTVKEEIIPSVSSTCIRNRSDGLKKLLPETVYNYVTERKLYNA